MSTVLQFRDPSSPPALPESVLRLVRPRTVGGRFSEDGRTFLGCVEEWRVPAVVAEDIPSVRIALGEIDRFLEPGGPGENLSLVYRLLIRYPDKRDLSERDQRLDAEDWAEDVEDYPAWAVREACRTWRRTRKWRPQSCEIIELCEGLVEPHRRIRERLSMIMMSRFNDIKKL
jgi:hypothetical protein